MVSGPRRSAGGQQRSAFLLCLTLALGCGRAVSPMTKFHSDDVGAAVSSTTPYCFPCQWPNHQDFLTLWSYVVLGPFVFVLFPTSSILHISRRPRAKISSHRSSTVSESSTFRTDVRVGDGSVCSWKQVSFYPRRGEHARVPAVAGAALRADYAKFVFCVDHVSRSARLSVATGKVIATLEGASSTRASRNLFSWSKCAFSPASHLS